MKVKKTITQKSRRDAKKDALKKKDGVSVVSVSDDDKPVAVLRKPATSQKSWKDTDLKVVIAESKSKRNKGDPRFQSLKESEDYPDGVLDPRAPSRNQRNTFLHFMESGSSEIKDADRTEYTRLITAREVAGKQKLMNQIVNKYTSRACAWIGELEPKEMSIEKRYETNGPDRHLQYVWPATSNQNY
jgi:hypothetical protein